MILAHSLSLLVMAAKFKVILLSEMVEVGVADSSLKLNDWQMTCMVWEAPIDGLNVRNSFEFIFDRLCNLQ